MTSAGAGTLVGERGWITAQSPQTFERFPGAAHRPLPPGYRPRTPRATALYRLVDEHLEAFLTDACERSARGFGMPRFVERSFRRYLDCGLIERGFARVRCRTDGCPYEMLVPFSCKRRGVCPSCEGRRMSDTAAHLCDRVLPRAPYRQWTLSFPRWLRFRLARDGRLLSRVIKAFLGCVASYLRRLARRRGVRDPHVGAVTAVQRFSGFVSLNLHLHSLLPDGVFARADDDKVSFVPLPPPTTEDVVDLTRTVIRRVAKILTREDDEPGDGDPGELARAQAESVKAYLPGVPRRLLPDPSTTKKRCALLEGFSLHADVRVHQSDRLGLERLCRYLLRPPIAKDRLSLADDGTVSYRFRRPAPSGAAELRCSPVEFLRRLATLIPPPRQNTLRYHGVFAARSKLRPLVVPCEDDGDDDETGHDHAATLARPEPEAGRAKGTRSRRLDWASLLRRVSAKTSPAVPGATDASR